MIDAIFVLDDIVLAPLLIFCVDGGARHALQLGLKPDRLIGDFDSIDRVELEKLTADGVPVDRFPAEKDQTDLELSLRQACQEKPDCIIIVGAFGGRPDHMLGNVMMFTQPEFSHIKTVLLEGDTQITFLYSGRSLTADGTAGDIVSLIPLSPVVTEVHLSGVRWPLRGETLSIGVSRTISNVLTEDKSELKITSGTLAVMYKGRGRGFIE